MSEERLQEIKDSIELQYKVQETNNLDSFNIFTDEEQELVDEIERLNKELEEYKKDFKEVNDLALKLITNNEEYIHKSIKDIVNVLVLKIERLNNNWNELEKFICDLEIECNIDSSMWGVAVIIHNKLRELKGVDK